MCQRCVSQRLDTLIGVLACVLSYYLSTCFCFSPLSLYSFLLIFFPIILILSPIISIFPQLFSNIFNTYFLVPNPPPLPLLTLVLHITSFYDKISPSRRRTESNIQITTYHTLQSSYRWLVSPSSWAPNTKDHCQLHARAKVSHQNDAAGKKQTPNISVAIRAHAEPPRAGTDF